MNYKAAFNDFFLSPKWVTNLLFAVLLLLIPGVNIAGAMVLVGWLIEGFWCRTDESPVTFPELSFDFAKIERYITLGIWPVVIMALVGIAVSIVLIPIAVIALFLHLAWAVSLAVFFLVLVCARPLALRASLTQDFVKALDFKFVIGFVKRMLPELLITSLVLALPMMLARFIMMATFGLGYLVMIAVPGVVMYAAFHLDKQLYKIYLSRGGEAIPLSPKLAPVLPPVVNVESSPQ